MSATTIKSPLADKWHNWLLHNRFGGDMPTKQRSMMFLEHVAQKILGNAAIQPGETLLDVGTGDGLVAFSALDMLGYTGKIILTDISEDLIRHCRDIVADCQFETDIELVVAPAEDLSAITDSSVDIITTRSVLIYVNDKQSAFNEFHRVLRKGGRLSIFEPINQFGFNQYDKHTYLGYDLSPLGEIAEKVITVIRANRGDSPLRSNPMLNFNERDLIDFAVSAGFDSIRLELDLRVAPATAAGRAWASFYNIAMNPNAPTLRAAVESTLTPNEADELISYLKPLVESVTPGGRSAVAYMMASKL